MLARGSDTGDRGRLSIARPVPASGASEHVVSLTLMSLQIEQFHAIFPREQLLIVTQEELLTDPNAVMNSVLAHVHLPTMDVSSYSIEDIGNMYAHTHRAVEVTHLIAALMRNGQPSRKGRAGRSRVATRRWMPT